MDRVGGENDRIIEKETGGAGDCFDVEIIWFKF
jgi:hypothetical protein